MTTKTFSLSKFNDIFIYLFNCMWLNVNQALFFSLPPTIKTFGLLMMDLYPWLKFIWIWMKSEIYRNETSLPSWFRVHEHLAQHKCCSDGHEQHANLWHVTEMLSTISPQTTLLSQPSVCCLNLFTQFTVRTT